MDVREMQAQEMEKTKTKMNGRRVEPESVIRFWSYFIGLLSRWLVVSSKGVAATARTNQKQDANKKMKKGRKLSYL